MKMQKLLINILATLLFLNVTSALANNAPRIVAIGSGVTETIYALKAEQDLVGVDVSSTWPVAATKLPQVGYQRTLTAEGVLALKPTLVIGTHQSGPEGTLKQLRDAGVEVVILPSDPTVETVKARLDKIATLVGKSQEGEALWKKVQADLDKAKQEQKNIKQQKRVLFLLAVPGRAPLAAGTNTEANTILQLADAKNVVTEFEGYRVLSPEAIQSLNPDIILLTDEGVQSLGGLDQIRQQPGIKHTKAAQDNAIISMDTNLLLSLGPRFGEAVVLLTEQLYPTVKK
jgi:iron complex transport system substrate-binding protein